MKKILMMLLAITLLLFFLGCTNTTTYDGVQAAQMELLCKRTLENSIENCYQNCNIQQNGLLIGSGQDTNFEAVHEITNACKSTCYEQELNKWPNDRNSITDVCNDLVTKT